MWTAKAQISLRIRAVWSGPSRSTNRIIGYYKIYERRTKVRIVLCTCAWWSESAHVRRHFFGWRETYMARDLGKPTVQKHWHKHRPLCSHCYEGLLGLPAQSNGLWMHHISTVEAPVMTQGRQGWSLSCGSVVFLPDRLVYIYLIDLLSWPLRLIFIRIYPFYNLGVTVRK